MRYIGFDMGDGESAVAAFEHGSLIEPVILPVCGSASLLSAVGLLSGEIVVGDRALTDALAQELSVRFKSRFTTDPASYEDVVRFVRGVLSDLRQSGALRPDDRFVVGCPAGWNTAARTRYRDLLVRAGVENPQVISESRAAFLYAKYARTVALDVDVLNESALVVDIGSSTLDFAYIVDGRETGVGTFGETALGGGLLDAALLRRAVERSRDRAALRNVLSESRSWYSYLEIEARVSRRIILPGWPPRPRRWPKKRSGSATTACSASRSKSTTRKPPIWWTIPCRSWTGGPFRRPYRRRWKTPPGSRRSVLPNCCF